MKKKYYILISAVICLIIFYYIDKEVFMKNRVLNQYQWISDDGTNRIRGDGFYTDHLRFKNDTMIFDYNHENSDTLILKYQYFSKIKIMDIRTKETGVYYMKGTNWVHKMMDNMKCKKK